MLNEIMTIKEAAQIWGVAVDTLWQKCVGRVKGDLAFKENECRKSAGTWLVTRQAMKRLYGENK